MRRLWSHSANAASPNTIKAETTAVILLLELCLWWKVPEAAVGPDQKGEKGETETVVYACWGAVSRLKKALNRSFQDLEILVLPSLIKNKFAGPIAKNRFWQRLFDGSASKLQVVSNSPITGSEKIDLSGDYLGRGTIPPKKMGGSYFEAHGGIR
ncbi:hypothetical protein N9A78_00935 [Akkermansiaceae bacterium]|jgi:hypothetical protein|nr:hypothetical protein [Akkermansiaceae bacterium]